MSMPPDSRPFTELLSDALNQLTTLVRTEIQLARTEMTAKLTKAGMGIAMLAAAAAVAIAALVLILMAIAVWLDHAGLPEGLANLIAGIIGAAIAGGLGWAGLQRLTAEELTPNRTIEQLQRDATAVKETMK